MATEDTVLTLEQMNRWLAPPPSCSGRPSDTEVYRSHATLIAALRRVHLCDSGCGECPNKTCRDEIGAMVAGGSTEGISGCRDTTCGDCDEWMSREESVGGRCGRGGWYVTRDGPPWPGCRFFRPLQGAPGPAQRAHEEEDHEGR
jgi:hypothetical protein